MRLAYFYYHKKINKKGYVIKYSLRIDNVDFWFAFRILTNV